MMSRCVAHSFLRSIRIMDVGSSMHSKYACKNSRKIIDITKLSSRGLITHSSLLNSSNYGRYYYTYIKTSNLF